MEKLFETVLGMSGTASIAILLVLLVRLALRKAPRVFSYALWAVVLLRLLCPFTIESAFSLLPAAQVEDVPGLGDAPAQVIQVQTGITTVDRQVNDFFLHHPYQGLPDLPEYAELPPQEPGPAPDWRTVPAAVWLAGTALLLGYSLWSLLRLRRRLVGSVPLAGEKNVRLADHIPSPFVLGVFRPKIYLPSSLPENERDYILLHERTHIRRCDHVFRALAWLALAVHWFNPLVWLAFRLAGRDMEMSCDEAVLRRMGRDVRADYSSSLLRLSQGGRLPTGPLAFGGGDPQSRIKNVLRYKKPAMWVMAVGLMAVLTACAALATSRAPDTLGADLDGLPAGLTFTLEERDATPFVRIGGSVDGIAMERTIWYPPEWFEQYEASPYPLGQLWFEASLCGDEAACTLDACWTDESRTAVKVTAAPSAMISSYSQAGNLIFTVSLEDGGTLLDMDGHVPKLSPNAPELVPTEEEAVRVGGIAAKLLTGAEEFYANARPAFSIGFTPVYTMYEQGRVRVEGEGLGRRAYVEWSEYGGLYLAGDPGGLCPVLAGKRGEGGASWKGQNKTALEVTFNVNDERVSSGTVNGFRIQFTADLGSGTITEKDFQSLVEGETLELADQEMIDMARILAVLMQGAEDYYKSDPPLTPTELAIPTVLGVSYSLNELGDGVYINGLDCGGALWFPWVVDVVGSGLNLPKEGALGCLSVTGPRFWGGYFANAQGNAFVQYYPEESAPLLVMCYDDFVDSIYEPSSIQFTVDLAAGKVIERNISGYAGEAPAPEFSDEELVPMARLLAGLIEGAADFYQVALPASEEGSLPFDEPMKLMFCSGAGGWRTIMTLHPDGSFEGTYNDSDMGAFGGVEYICTFHGKFGNIKQVTAASWSMTLEELTLDTGHPVGEEWIEERRLYISSTPYGLTKRVDEWTDVTLEPGAEFMFYTPEAKGYAPGDELYGMNGDGEATSFIEYQFWTWWPDKHDWGPDSTLGSWGLCNMEMGYGFFDLQSWGIG